MRYPEGTPSDGDVPVFRSSDGLVHWESAPSGGISADLQNQLNALAFGQGIPLTLEPSYDNVGGQGDRRSIITVTQSGALASGFNDATKLVNGSYSDTDVATAGGSVAGQTIRLTFARAVLITELAVDLGAGSNGNWQIRASQDGTNWATLTTAAAFTSPSGTGSGGGSDHASRTNQWIIPIPNAYAYKIYELIGVSGTGSVIYVQEIDCKILGLE